MAGASSITLKLVRVTASVMQDLREVKYLQLFDAGEKVGTAAAYLVLKDNGRIISRYRDLEVGRDAHE